MKLFTTAAAALLLAASASQAAIIISEVHPTGSSTTTYAADWFELTNTGSSAVDITGWKVDDNSNSFGSSLALRNVTSIGAGQSVVFIESNTSGTNDPTVTANFTAAWFGASAPANFTIGTYGGSNIGLSSGGDAVNIFDASGALITRVDVGAATSGVTFDNAAGLNNVTISTLSAVGTNGAFTSVAGGEVGSPGTTTNAIPEPAAMSLLGLALPLVARRRR